MSAISREALHTENAPAAVGPYSQAVRVDRTIYISGQIPFDPKTMTCVEGGIEAQTKQVMENMKAILENAGCDFSNGEYSDKYGTIICFRIIFRALFNAALKNIQNKFNSWGFSLVVNSNHLFKPVLKPVTTGEFGLSTFYPVNPTWVLIQWSKRLYW